MRVWSFLYGNEHTPLFIYLCLLQICVIAYVTYLSYR